MIAAAVLQEVLKLLIVAMGPSEEWQIDAWFKSVKINNQALADVPHWGSLLWKTTVSNHVLVKHFFWTFLEHFDMLYTMYTSVCVCARFVPLLWPNQCKPLDTLCACECPRKLKNDRSNRFVSGLLLLHNHFGFLLSTIISDGVRSWRVVQCPFLRNVWLRIHQNLLWPNCWDTRLAAQGQKLHQMYSSQMRVLSQAFWKLRRQARRVHQSLWMRFSLGEWPIDVSCLLKIHIIQNICRFYISTKPLKVHGRRHNQALKYWPSRIMYSQVFMPLLCLEIFWVGCRRLIQLDKAVMADLQRRLGPLETVPHRASSLMVPVPLGFVAWQNSFLEPMQQTPMEQLPLFF